MPQIRPFKGIVYNQEKVKKMSAVVAPPYDVIPKDMQEELYRESPYNVVRLILGKIKKADDGGDNRYKRAKAFFESWLNDRIMLRDDKDSLYIYSQGYKEATRAIERIGFIGLMGMDTKKGNRILPHENTLAAPKLDRLNLMREVRANLSPIFVLYDDEKHAIVNILRKVASKKKPFVDVNFGNVRHRVWRLDDDSLIKKIEQAMLKKDIFIADGHHRYEVARAYSMQIQNENLPEAVKTASEFLMVYFVESDEKTLTVLPAHRLVKDAGTMSKEGIIIKLDRFFQIEKVEGLKEMMSRLHSLRNSHVFGMYLGRGAYYVLRLKDIRRSDEAIKDKPKDWKRLDISILHLFILQHVLGIRDEDDNMEFVKDPKEAAPLIDKGKYALAFFLNPTKVSEVKRIAKLGLRMPRKATYFYPKPLSGLVTNKH